MRRSDARRISSRTCCGSSGSPPPTDGSATEKAAGVRSGSNETEATAMGMAGTLREYLDRHAVAYELLRHSRTRTSSETAEAAHVSGSRLAKPVVIED